MPRALLIFVSAALLFGALQFEVIRPGDPALDTQHIRAEVDTLLYLFPHENEVYIGGVLAMRTESGDVDGEPVFIRIERSFDLENELIQVDSFVVAQATLAPRSRWSMDADGEESHVFERRNGAAFYGNSMDMILASLPLGPDYAARLATHNEDTTGEEEVTVRVMDLSPVTTMAGEDCNAWEVQVEHGPHQGTYWIERAGGALLRYMPPDRSMMLASVRRCVQDS